MAQTLLSVPKLGFCSSVSGQWKQNGLFENGTKLEMFAAVIMPNHVHLLFSALEAGNAEPYSLAEIMKPIKGVSARNINRLLNGRGSLWQDESFDRIMRAQEYEWKRNYIIANPIDAGLC